MTSHHPADPPTDLLGPVLDDPTLAAALEDAREGRVRALDLTGPEALRPFVTAGLVRAGRTVLAVTAYAGKGDEERIRDAGAADYLAKPVSIGPFMTAVRTLLPA